jgi:hypothetical protein
MADAAKAREEERRMSRAKEQERNEDVERVQAASKTTTNRATATLSVESILRRL